MLAVVILILLILLAVTYHKLVVLRREFDLRLKLAMDEWKKSEEERIRNETLSRSRAVLKGRIAEQIVPFLEEFRYNPSDARFLGSPVDYVIFDGMSEGSTELTVILADVKTGKPKLTPIQERIKAAIEAGRVRWETIQLYSESESNAKAW